MWPRYSIVDLLAAVTFFALVLGWWNSLDTGIEEALLLSLSLFSGLWATRLASHARRPWKWKFIVGTGATCFVFLLCATITGVRGFGIWGAELHGKNLSYSQYQRRFGEGCADPKGATHIWACQRTERDSEDFFLKATLSRQDFRDFVSRQSKSIQAEAYGGAAPAEAPSYAPDPGSRGSHAPPWWSQNEFKASEVVGWRMRPADYDGGVQAWYWAFNPATNTVWVWEYYHQWGD